MVLLHAENVFPAVRRLVPLLARNRHFAVHSLVKRRLVHHREIAVLRIAALPARDINVVVEIHTASSSIIDSVWK